MHDGSNEGEGKKHDSGMLADSNLLPLLQQHCHRANGSALCIYGDPAYPLRAHLQISFESNHLPQEQKDFNKFIKLYACLFRGYL